MKIPRNAFAKVIEGLLESGARSATVYLSATQRVTATHIHKPNRRNRHTTIAVTYGQLNWAGREFVKMCRKVGEPLPVKKVQLKWWPKKRKKK